MKKVLVATEKPFAPAAIEGIRQIVEAAGYELSLLESYTDKADLLEAVADKDAIIIRSDKITADVMDAASNLKIVVRAGAGYDNIDCAAAKERDVVAMNTPGQNANAVAELVFGMMVMHARKGYSGKAGTELRDKKIGIHAYGNIGKLVAHIAKGFGMAVFAYDPFVDRSVVEADEVKYVDSMEKLYTDCDFISLHIPATEKTINSINYDLLSKMPEGGVLVNTARKEVIDEEGIMKLMADKPTFSYISDIAPSNAAELQEKYPERCFFTPKKMGAQTSEANINAGLAAARQIVGFLENGDKTFQVNK